MKRDEFLRAWKRWDDRPGARETAVEFQDACTRLAGRYGVTTVQLRQALCAARQGSTPGEALDAVLARIAESAA